MNLSTLIFNTSTFFSSFTSLFCLIFGVAVLIFLTTSLNSNPNFLKLFNLFFNAVKSADSVLKSFGFTSDNLAKFLAIVFYLKPISLSVAALILLIFDFCLII